VAIGGTWNWYGTATSGVALRDSFTSNDPNVVYVFAQTIIGWRPDTYGAAIATTASHEAGHAFGLDHQRLFDLRTGELLDEYYDGTDEWTPIMGGNLADDRTTWHNGSVGVFYSPFLRLWWPIIQEDMAIIANDANGFGYRPDDHGDIRRTATTLLPSREEGRITGRGVIETTSDRDYFAFIATGDVRLTVYTAATGPNLDAKIELRDADGRLVASADPDDSLEAMIRADGLVGNYYVVVTSHGNYGDVGQYTVTGTVSNLRLLGRGVRAPFGTLSAPRAGDSFSAGVAMLVASPVPGMDRAANLSEQASSDTPPVFQSSAAMPSGPARRTVDQFFGPVSRLLVSRSATPRNATTAAAASTALDLLAVEQMLDG
jgi:hypothetical protein